MSLLAAGGGDGRLLDAASCNKAELTTGLRHTVVDSLEWLLTWQSRPRACRNEEAFQGERRARGRAPTECTALVIEPGPSLVPLVLRQV
jgi:glyoxylate carboligase